MKKFLTFILDLLETEEERQEKIDQKLKLSKLEYWASWGGKAARFLDIATQAGQPIRVEFIPGRECLKCGEGHTPSNSRLVNEATWESLETPSSFACEWCGW